MVQAKDLMSAYAPTRERSLRSIGMCSCDYIANSPAGDIQSKPQDVAQRKMRFCSASTIILGSDGAMIETGGACT